MNRRGEVEIAINKRWIERGIYALIIVALIAFVLWKTVVPHTAAAQVNATAVQDQLAQKQAEIDRLNSQLAKANTSVTSPPVAPPAQITPPVSNVSNSSSSGSSGSSAAASAASARYTDGKIGVDWSVDSTRLTPAQFNADVIATMQAQYDTMKTKLADDTTLSASDRSDMRTKMNDLNANITLLSRGFTRYRVNNITIAITNGKTTDTTIDYTACWTIFDCTKLYTPGNFTAPAGQKTVQNFQIHPSLIQLDSGSQYLSIYVYANTLSILNDTKTFTDVPQN